MSRRVDEGAATGAAERERCLAVIDDMIDAAESRRKGHQATAWLKHARDAIACGTDPRELYVGSPPADEAAS